MFTAIRGLLAGVNASKRRAMKFALGVVLTAIAVFAWEALSWTALGWHESGYRQFRDQSAMSEMMGPSLTNVRTQASGGAGIYMLPARPKPTKVATIEEIRAAEKEFQEALTNGPYVYAIVRPGRRDISMANNLMLSFLRSLICAAIIASLLMHAMLPYAGRIVFVAAAGLFAGLLCDMPMWVWFENPGRDTIVNIVDHFFTWIVGGSVLGVFVGRDVVLTK